MNSDEVSPFVIVLDMVVVWLCLKVQESMLAES